MLGYIGAEPIPSSTKPASATFCAGRNSISVPTAIRTSPALTRLRSEKRSVIKPFTARPAVIPMKYSPAKLAAVSASTPRVSTR